MLPPSPKPDWRLHPGLNWTRRLEAHPVGIHYMLVAFAGRQVETLPVGVPASKWQRCQRQGVRLGVETYKSLENTKFDKLSQKFIHV